MLDIQKALDKRIFYIMCEQPNCCPQCQSRTEILQDIEYEKEKVQVNFCYECKEAYFFINE